MALTGFGLTPSDGLKNTVSFPTSPASEAAARKQIQDVIDQVVADGNTLKSELAAVTGAAEIGCTGATANVQAFITAIEAAGSGTTPGAGVVTDNMMATDVKIGSLAALIATITGTNRDNVVAAINFVVGLLGTYSLLTTTEKGNLVAAINEVNAKTVSVLTTLGDIIVRGASDAQRLAIGTAYQSLNVNSAGNGLQYQTSLQSLMTAAGDIIVASGANTPARKAKGSALQVLQVNAGGTDLEYADKMTYAGFDGQDFATSINSGATLTKTIPLGVSAKFAIVTLGVNGVDSMFRTLIVGIGAGNSKALFGYNYGGTGYVGYNPAHFFDDSPTVTGVALSDIYISGTDLIIKFENGAGSPETIKASWKGGVIA